jgi:hypothetical protein
LAPTGGSCKDREYFSCRPSQFVGASEGKFVASVAEMVPAAGPESRKIAEVLAVAFAEASAVEAFVVDCSGRTDSIVAPVAFVVAAFGLAVGIRYRKTTVGLAAALAIALSGY